MAAAGTIVAPSTHAVEALKAALVVPSTGSRPKGAPATPSSTSSGRAPAAPLRGAASQASQVEQLEHEKRALLKEKRDLQQRLDFVEELVGPTEALRKELHEQVVAARAAALRAKHQGANIPTKVTGRLDERLLWLHGLSERDAGLLQSGCLPDADGILQDVSILGDPVFQPYDRDTGEARWQACGGLLKLSLAEVRRRFGDAIAQDVIRCAKELDTYDASRRVGAELPWHPLEDRELQAAEVIDLMDRERLLQSEKLTLLARRDVHGPGLGSARDSALSPGAGGHPGISPYAVAVSARRRRRPRVPAMRPPLSSRLTERVERSDRRASGCDASEDGMQLPRLPPLENLGQQAGSPRPGISEPFQHPLVCLTRGRNF